MYPSPQQLVITNFCFLLSWDSKNNNCGKQTYHIPGPKETRFVEDLIGETMPVEDDTLAAVEAVAL